MKDFLKQHYDKVLLLGLFCVFIALMVMVQGIISSTKEITEDSLKIPKRKADHQQVDPQSEELNTQLQKNQGKVLWNDNGSRNAALNIKTVGDYSDLASVFPIAKCPYCSTDTKANFIPLSSFSSKEEKRNCPICSKHLPVPPERRFANLQGVENDDDRDGISNQDEERYGLNPRNPDDALYDDDNDGFSNVFEITNNFDPKNSKSAPPVWWRLRLVDVKQIELPVRFMKINDNNSDDKSKWLLQFNVKRRKREETEWLALGEMITIDRTDYKIVDVIRDIKQVKITEGHQAGQSRTEDKSRVILVEELYGEERQADRLKMYAGQPAYSSDERPVLEDVGFYPPVEYALQIGSVIKVPVMPSGSNSKRYRVEKSDADKMIVWIVDLRASRGGEQTLIEITKEGKVPPAMRIGEKKRDVSGVEGE